MDRSPRRWPLRLAVLAVSTLLSLLLLEGVLRLLPRFDPHPGAHDALFEYDAALGWRFVPQAREIVSWPGEYRSEVVINGQGFRDVEWADGPLPEGRSRIAILGDSFATNLGVPLPEIFTRRLETLLGNAAEVRNYGVNGYCQTQELLLLEREILPEARPDLVLVLLYPRNDLDENGGRYWTQRYSRPRAFLDPRGELQIDLDLPRHSPPPPSAWQRFLVDLRLRAALRELWYRLRPDRVPLHDLPPELRLCGYLDEREQRAFDLTMALLRRMRERCEEQGARFGVVMAPSLWQVDPRRFEEMLRHAQVDPGDFDRTQPQRELTKRWEREGIACLDLLPALEEATEREGLLYFPAEQHWNGKAQAVVAEAIAGWLAR